MTIERDDGWKGFRIQGPLDFSLIGILSKISGILADHKIGIFTVSTYILINEMACRFVNESRRIRAAKGGIFPCRIRAHHVLYWLTKSRQ